LFFIFFLKEKRKSTKKNADGKMGPDHLCLEETIHLLESQRQAKTLTACLDFSKEWFSQAQIKIRSGLATIHLLSFHRTSLLSFQKKKKTMLRWKKVLNRNGQAWSFS
jgi:hypothetical protein